MVDIKSPGIGQPPSKDTLTSMMSSGPRSPSGDLGSTPRPVKLGEKTRVAWKFVRPYWNKTAWWGMLTVAVLMVAWEIDDLWAGTIYNWVGWTRDNLLKRFPIIPFMLGILVRHYVLRDDRWRSQDPRS